MYGFRIFISYAHTDRVMVERLDAFLADMGLQPVWDRGLRPGRAFDDEIRRQIARAHIFMPLITPNSRESRWVHQEIGYALGIDVPVVPVALGSIPGEMLAPIQAICVDSELAGLREGLERADLESLVLTGALHGELDRLGITTNVAELGEDRTRTLARYAEEVRGPARVRQRAIFSSFSLPAAEPSDELWNSLDLPAPRSEYFRALLRNERKILEKHARDHGCSLILNPFLDFATVGAGVHRSQLGVLKDFLVSMPKEKITVAFVRGTFLGNLTLVGDWFGATALPPRSGSEYRQTIFSHHAPTVLRWMRAFEQELKANLRKAGVAHMESRDYAVDRIEARLRDLRTA